MQIPIDPNASELHDINHAKAEGLMRAFDLMAERLGTVSNATAMWALAMLTAKVFAACAMQQEVQDATSRRFADMLRIAYPPVLQAMEQAQRQAEGRQPYDA